MINLYSQLMRSGRWVAVRVDGLGALFSASLAAYLFYSRDLATNESSDVGFTLSMAGNILNPRMILSLMIKFDYFYIVMFSSLLLAVVRIYNDFEVSGKCRRSNKAFYSH